ncbi:8-oxoguanine glycosylase ogg1 [Ascosphaera pollenicola]|nr:8-oxoguanine glycosylase ogg1 [Ascosphaera pollenicola]
MVVFTEWKKLSLDLAELSINTTLRCGQSFRWRTSAEGEWSCALDGRIVSLRQDSKHLHYRAGFPIESSKSISTAGSSAQHCSRTDDTEALLRHYFALNVDLSALYRKWSASDANFKEKAPRFTGVRILRQDAWETLVSFICSSNNNISRISQMVEKLCINYGPLIGYLGDKAYHGFPAPEKLTGDGVETRLRELGFGYRAKYIHQTAQMVVNDHDEDWLATLTNPESPPFGVSPSPAGSMAPEGREGYRKAHEALIQLQGVGPKVADCVCLMGLGWSEAVPVDTHVWQIAQRDYKLARSSNKTLTLANYMQVSNRFRAIWGEYAGWAQSVLFTANLRAFQEQANTEIQVQEKIQHTLEDDKGLLIKQDITDQHVTVSNVLLKGKSPVNETTCEDTKSRPAKRRRLRDNNP